MIGKHRRRRHRQRRRRCRYRHQRRRRQRHRHHRQCRCHREVETRPGLSTARGRTKIDRNSKKARIRFFNNFFYQESFSRRRSIF